ncbi:Autocrine proliferation repressor protein A [Diplonema papillatum]|nr:Autocrine proliferation repressor protein A [Diplonema papillatum]
MLPGIVLAASLAGSMHTDDPLDEYINWNDGAFDWADTGLSYETPMGGTAYLLNVTSQRWDHHGCQTDGIGGGLWKHQMLYFVPAAHTKKNKAVLQMMSGPCNDLTPDDMPAIIASARDAEILDGITASVGCTGALLFQIPNCRITCGTEPSAASLDEDSFMAYTWARFAADPTEPRGLAQFPMTKAVFQAMRAAGRFGRTRRDRIDSWFVSGVSKRGWTTWLAGTVRCRAPWCPQVVGIAPLVPVVPNLVESLHQHYRSLGGWSWAFGIYHAWGATVRLDAATTKQQMEATDPIHRLARLRSVVTHVVLATADEFMLVGSAAAWWGRVPGRKVLTVFPNESHLLLDVVPGIVKAVGETVYRVFTKRRPVRIESHFEPSTGILTAHVHPQPLAVHVQRGNTSSLINRDFRWLRVSGSGTGACEAPEVSIPALPAYAGANCVAMVAWSGRQVSEECVGTYKAGVPVRPEGGWTGFFIEATYPSFTGDGNYTVTTPAYVWPDTYPNDDCSGTGCLGTLV